MNRWNLLQLLALQVAISLGYEHPSQNAPAYLRAPLLLYLPQAPEHQKHHASSSSNARSQGNCENPGLASNASPEQNGDSYPGYSPYGVSGPSPIGILNPILPVLPGPLHQSLSGLGLAPQPFNNQVMLQGPSYNPETAQNPIHHPQPSTTLAGMHPFFPPSQHVCLRHTLVPVNRQVVDECITNVPVVRKSVRHQEETVTRHVPIVERTLSHQEEKIVRHVPIQHKSLHNVVEMRTHFVPVVKSRTRTVLEPYTVHVPITERYTRPVHDSITRNVPFTETVSRPLIYEKTRYVPVTEKVIRPIIETNIYTVPVKRRYLKTIIEQRARPVRVPCESCYAEQIESCQPSLPALAPLEVSSTDGDSGDLPQIESQEDISSSSNSLLTSSPVPVPSNVQRFEPFPRPPPTFRIAPLALVPTGDLPSGPNEDFTSASSSHLMDAPDTASQESQLSHLDSKPTANIPLGNLVDRISALSGATLGPIDYVSPYVTISECLT